MKYSIWCKSDNIPSVNVSVQLLGTFNAKTFNGACKQLYKKLPEKLRQFLDLDNKTYFGCKLFDNEIDARNIQG